MRLKVRGTVTAFAAAAFVCVPAAAAAGPPAGLHGALDVRVVSSPPQYVSGDDARVEVAVPDATPLAQVRVTVNGADVTSAFAQDPEGNHQLEGVVTGLPLGPSTVEATVPGPGNARPDRAELRLVNHPLNSEPAMFSGPWQKVFKCTAPNRLANADIFMTQGAEPSCAFPTQVKWMYRTTANTWSTYTPGAPRPADMATTTTMGGDTVDFIVRWERGVIDRFIYSIATLSPASQTATPDLSAWNGVLIDKFEGGVAIGHYQGNPQRDSMLYLPGLALGYAIAYSTGTVTATHYNLQLGGETAIMVKDRFVSAYGEPRYTVGVGGSGGAIQQYVYGQNHPGLLDAAIPQYSYPDMVTQTIHVGDCELLERWADSKVIAEGPLSMWATWVNRSLIEGLNASATFGNPYAALMPYMPTPGSDECIDGWRGLSPLALNPWYGTAPGVTPQEQVSTKWTHWDDLVNIYGTDASGYARVPWDNVGVQYGLKALREGKITPAQFLDLNANVGSWKPSSEMVQEGCPYVGPCTPGNIDVWSARNMNLSPDRGVTPAPRREGDREAMYAAYRSGMVFRGKIDIPIIDWRHYLEDELNMHNSHQSFAARQRMLNYDGDASNQVIWFTDARPARAFDQTALALKVMDEWMRSIAAHPERGVAGNKPPQAVDSCFHTDGSLLASGDDVWNGILDDKPAGACTKAFPIKSTSRIVAGGPIEGGVFKCALQSVEDAIDRGLYGSWGPDAAQVARLQQIFPTGVCDYRKRDLGLPPEMHAHTP
jgi:hypothetical protein